LTRSRPRLTLWDFRRPRRALTLAEVAISSVVVATMLCAALNTLGASATARRLNADRARGLLLAEALMTESLNQAYREPQNVSIAFGPETGETAGGARNAFDDVDDYHGWNAGPPTQADGTALTGFADWRRTVNVAWVQPDNVAQTSGTESGVKRITVTTSVGAREAASLTAVRSWGNSPPQATANVSSGWSIGEKVFVYLGDSVECDATDSFDPDGDTLTYFWNFGDGHIATEESLDYEYQARGLYTLKLTAYDGRGGVGYDLRQIVVGE